MPGKAIANHANAVNGFADHDASSHTYTTSLDQVPVTAERKTFIARESNALADPGTARANIAVSVEAPQGTTQDNWAAKNKHRSVMQQHCLYWDQDDDGIIWPYDTYRGCRNWGWAIPLAFLAMVLINVNLSYATGPSIIPDPFFRIYLNKIHKDKHGSDSMTYDNEGRFRPQQFEELFTKYDRGNKGGLDLADLLRMHKGQRMAMDFFGWTATFLEWFAVYLLLWPEDGVMRKDDLRRVFDGSIFQQKADEYAKKQQLRQAR